MWKWVRRGLLLLALMVAVLVLICAGIFWRYRSVISAKPGGLNTGIAPGQWCTDVDPFIGTGGVIYMCPHATPAAMAPFGMVRLGPDTRSIITNWAGLNKSGYYYGDNKVIGFSHNRLIGADVHEGGQFRVFPTTEARLEWACGQERFAKFSHVHETAFPGYYAVVLPKDDTLVELTATPRVGIHRYTFRKQEAPCLVFDITSALGERHCKDGHVRVLPGSGEMEGWATSFGSFSSRYDGLKVYFAAEFSEPIRAHRFFVNGAVDGNGGEEASADDLVVGLVFNKSDSSRIEARVALSCVSVENAKANLDAETRGKTFEDVYAGTRNAWEKRLSTIAIEGGTARERRIFYSALYRTFQMPTVFNDVNGEYMGFDKTVHVTSGRYFTDFSLWDTFRTVHPLYNLIARDDQREMMVSLTEMAKTGGAFPRWPAGAGYTNCMFGTPADIAVTEAYLKGIRDFDIQSAYENMRRTATEGPPEGSRFGGRDGLKDYLELGYCPDDKIKRSVAKTLEYAYCDYSLSLLARELSMNADAGMFAARAQSYRNLWDANMDYFLPRSSSGVFFTDIRPARLSYVDFDEKYTRGYVEGSALQWRWSVPFDMDGLVSLFDSTDQFVRELESYFENASSRMGAFYPGGHYWHGNEPYIHAAYLFNHAGRPDLTQKWVRWILDARYDDNYVGLDGNDDGGTLSAWYVLSALGIYPIAGTTRYELGSPLFEKTEVKIGDAVLTITAINNAPQNTRVESISLNGERLDRTWITHDEISVGGTLAFEMRSAIVP